MAVEDAQSLVQRRRAAAAARAAAKTAPVEAAAKVASTSQPTVDLNPDPADDLIAERRRQQSASLERQRQNKVIALPVADKSRQMDTGDLVMPKLKVSQAMSKVNSDDIVRQGNWYLSTTNRNLTPAVYIVPLDFRKALSRFVQGEGVVCRSFDLIQGEGNPGILCEGTEEEIHTLPASERGCPFRLWTKDEATGKNVPPPCGLSYNYPVLILDPEDLENGKTTPAMLSLRSTGAKVAKLLNSIVTEGVLDDPVWHEVVLKLGLEKQTNTRGTFYVPTVDYEGETAGATAARAASMASSFATNNTSIRRSIENDDTE